MLKKLDTILLPKRFVKEFLFCYNVKKGGRKT